MRKLIASPDGNIRLQTALEWLGQHPPDAEILVVAASRDAGHDLCRRLALQHGARFGLQRTTLYRLALEMARERLVKDQRVPATRLTLTALVARVVHRLDGAGALVHYQPVATCPGFAPALVETLEELRLHGVDAERLATLPHIGSDLRQLLTHLEAELAQSAMADRATVYRIARTAASNWRPVPLLLLDLQVHTEAEAGLLAALAERAPEVLATAVPGDETSIALLASSLSVSCFAAPLPATPRSLDSLKAHLFESTQPDERPLDDSVTLASWPGEARECLEMVRGIQQAAGGGLAFDRMAVLLHSPAVYAPHLEEAFTRAGIPAFFSAGTRRPHPAGRALLALLHCADEGLSAQRFAEYLSLAQVPATATTAPWVPPDHDLLPAADPAQTPDDPAYLELQGQLQPAHSAAPWRWEQLLIDASVIGGLDRWERRLRGHGEELRLQQAALAAEHPERAALLGRTRDDLAHLQSFALPLLRQLDGLPSAARWDAWLAALRHLAAESLRDPDPVLRKLEELTPMGNVGPVKLDEVLLVLGDELREVTVKPTGRRYGAVYVAPTAAARGLTFDVVFVPGLAEKVFPHKIVEDPVLLDTARRLLAAGLSTQAQRVADERLSLRLAVGAASRQACLSYPRLDVQQARPRVPSFYSLEVMRAAEGRLPGYEQLNQRATRYSAGRLGWPAPENPSEAIDEAEYDLALLAPLITAAPDTVSGTASYLMGASPHLSRSLRARWGRANLGWTIYDGLMRPDALAQAALAKHQLDQRSFSPTALENYAVCPYRFFLNALMRLTPREVPAAVEHMDPLTRGSLVHEVQFDILSQLRDEGRLPITADGLGAASELADRLLDSRARQWEEKLAPAIPRVWEDAVNLIRSDIRQWLRKMVSEPWVPERFELSFGLSDRARTQADPASVGAAVQLPIGIQVRGSIDLVEHHPSGRRRATDYKTGKEKAQSGDVVRGGEVLQPLVYAMVLEQLLGPPVTGGRLYYCTTDGNFKTVDFPLEQDSIDILREVVSVVGDSLQHGSFPAAPRKQGCQWCNFRPVCGSQEESRTGRKPEVQRLTRLRQLQ